MGSEAMRALLEALLSAIDEEKLRAELDKFAGPRSRPAAPSSKPASIARDPRFLLEDILDDSILAAKAGDKSYPLRLLLSELSTRTDDTAFTFLCAMNVYFRIEADDEVKMRLGHEVSRLFYRFMDEARPEGLATAQVSGLVAALLTTELQRVRFEAVDHASTFDSQIHERLPGSDAQSSSVRRPASFACRVAQTGNVRIKALVVT